MQIHFSAPDLFNSTPGFYQWVSQRGRPLIQGCKLPPQKRGRKPGRSTVIDDSYMAGLRKRFYAKVDKEGPIGTFAPHLGPCWLWTAFKAGTGYGFIGNAMRKRRPELAHRISLVIDEWERTGVIRPLPEGHDIEVDHLCMVKSCVRPSHLEWVTQQENKRRRPNYNLPICGRGHPFTEENTRMTGNKRRCRQCAADYMRADYARRKAAGETHQRRKRVA